MDEQDESTLERAPSLQTGAINFAPRADVTVPDRTEWHLVADHEIDALANPPAGVTGAVGFAALGAALGALPAGCTALDRGTSAVAIPAEAFRALLVLAVCGSLSIACLAFFFYLRLNAQNVLKNIRSRPKRPGQDVEANQRG